MEQEKLEENKLIENQIENENKEEKEENLEEKEERDFAE